MADDILELLPQLRGEGGVLMSECIHLPVCGRCDVEPEDCGFWEPARTCRMEHERAESGLVHLWRCSECDMLNVTLFERPASYCQHCGVKVVHDEG